MHAKRDANDSFEPSREPNASFFEMSSLCLWAPTYFGHRHYARGGQENKEFDNPQVPLLIQIAEGIRVILGTHNENDWNAPDVKIERRPKGWAIFLHPSAGDPCGYVYFLDDGRSFFVKESGPTAIELIDDIEVIPELDDMPDPNSNSNSISRIDTSVRMDSIETENQEERQCGQCGQVVADIGDWYGELCPNCADATDGI